ncbi:MAG: T9SS type A sorting domain-containing protein [Crocinitomicaceae bacterium]|nr:T9SS type A sorting domain-containing protein [Crocinitomicaceae bacterium]
MKSFLIALSSFLTITASAQTAPDFTITTTDGIMRNLYSTLDQGKSVLLDFFYPSCQGCWFYAPIIEQSYLNNGAGTGNIEYWGINGGNEIVDDAAIIAYRQQYGISNPCASGLDGNGKYVDSLYFSTFTGIGYPTYAVICPDRTVHWNVNNPPTETGFDAFFGTCETTSLDEALNEASWEIYPNPSNGIFILSGTIDNLEVFDAIGRLVLSTDKSTIDLSKEPKGVFFVKNGNQVKRVLVL